MLAVAIQYHRAGRFADAEKIYVDILAHEPNHADALHLLGVMASKMGKHLIAIEYINKALAVNPVAPEFHNSLGAVHQALGNMPVAVQLYLRAIELKGDYLEPHNNLLRLLPEAVDIRYHLAVVLHQQGRLEQAIEHYSKVLEIQPTHAGALNNLGCGYRDLGRLDEALTALTQAVNAQPDYAEAYHNLAFVLQEKGMCSEAVSAYRNALSLKPDFADAHSDYGKALQSLGEFDTAILHYRKAISLVPGHIKAHYNWAAALHEQGRDEDAIDKYAEALRYDPGFVEAHVNRAFILLIHGRYPEGWAEYEWRMQRPDWLAVNAYYPELPRWDGSDAQGKTILVQAEQGIGDTIQFSRYFPLIKERCSRLVVEAQPELHALLETNPAIDELVVRGPENASKADAAIHIMSLGKIFDTTIGSIPLSFPYIQAPAKRLEEWGGRISGCGFKIGITWSGNPAYPGNVDRSCGIQPFARLAELPDVRLYSLQKGQAADQLREKPAGMEVVDLGPMLNDFADTAAAIMNLDLLVSVDTALVHLAGALGKPIWTLRYFCPYWVWGLEGDRTPWYPSMRVFRQKHRGEWGELFRQVANELCAVYLRHTPYNA